MKAWGRAVGLAVVAAWATACEPLDDLDLGGGGGGGGAFSSGFVFVRNGAAGRDVNVVDEDSNNANSPTRLTTEGNAYEPTVSRSGLLVAFVYHPSGSAWELRTVPTTGTGTASTVLSSAAATCSGCSNFHTPAISPAGDSIVFTLTKGGTSALAKVNVDGTGFQVLTSGTYTYGAPSFYPDGRSVLAAASRGGQVSFLLNVDLTTGTTNVLTSSLGNSGATSVASRAVVSPDGTRVAFDGQTSNGTQIFVGQLASPGLANVTQLTRHTGESIQVLDTWPSWRGNSEVIFQSTAGGGDNLYRISTASSGTGGTLIVPSVIEPFYGGS